eukprot:5707289-Prymnesium_polylepis.1
MPLTGCRAAPAERLSLYFSPRRGAVQGTIQYVCVVGWQHSCWSLRPVHCACNVCVCAATATSNDAIPVELEDGWVGCARTRCRGSGLVEGRPRGPCLPRRGRVSECAASAERRGPWAWPGAAPPPAARDPILRLYRWLICDPGTCAERQIRQPTAQNRLPPPPERIWR